MLEFDKRGSGLSDHTFGSGTIEDRIDDIRAVMDAAGFGRAALQGAADGGPIALTFTATYPERVSSIVLHGSWARITWAPDYPIGVPPSAIEPILQFVEQSWGSGDVLAMFVGQDDRRDGPRPARESRAEPGHAQARREPAAHRHRDRRP